PGAPADRGDRPARGPAGERPRARYPAVRGVPGPGARAVAGPGLYDLVERGAGERPRGAPVAAAVRAGGDAAAVGPVVPLAGTAARAAAHRRRGPGRPDGLARLARGGILGPARHQDRADDRGRQQETRRPRPGANPGPRRL